MKHIGEVVVGEESGWQVIKWVEGAPPITVGMKLYADVPTPAEASTVFGVPETLAIALGRLSMVMGSPALAGKAGDPWTPVVLCAVDRLIAAQQAPAAQPVASERIRKALDDILQLFYGGRLNALDDVSSGSVNAAMEEAEQVFDALSASQQVEALQANADATSEAVAASEASGLSDAQIDRGWRAVFSTENPYCPCNLKSFTKAVRWAEAALASKDQS